MMRLVCYDIANPKRLRKIAKVCESYGIRIQKSCIQVDVEDQERFKNLISDIKNAMDRKNDSLLVYSICKDCANLSKHLGPNKILDFSESIFL